MTLDELILEMESSSFLDGDTEALYRKYAKVCHPDTCSDSRAKDVFVKLQELYNRRKNPTVIDSGKNKYTIFSPLFSGDVSEIYRDGDRLIKVSKGSSLNDLLGSEVKILGKINAHIKDNYPKLGYYIPSVVESFKARSKDSDTRECIVYEYDKDLISLEHVNSKRPVLHYADFAWMFKRMLISLEITHSSGYIHGAPLPSHCLINTKTHGGRLVGWVHSCRIGEKIRTISEKYRAYYPPEIFEKKRVSQATDLYILGKSSILLLGGDVAKNTLPPSVPVKIASFIKSMLYINPMHRPQSAIYLHDQFSDLMLRVFGKPKFREFQLDTV